MKDAHRESSSRRQVGGHIRRPYHDAPPQVRVTLSAGLLNHLRTESESTQVPLRWLVAGLVCDTMYADAETPNNHQVRIS